MKFNQLLLSAGKVGDLDLFLLVPHAVALSSVHYDI